ncbi:MAG TPA: Ku protein [Syntrophorhabdales bacterium]|nr:Ku protein [Syntrophorhabdales bacterium]
MAGKTLWKGFIHFKGIDVSVSLHTAVKEDRIQFQLLHKRDLIKLKEQMICTYERTLVPPEDQTRGFQLETGKYILVDPEELEQFAPEQSRMIEVHEFVEAEQIDPLFLVRGYYLEPETPAAEYVALAGAMSDLKMQGICTWTMRKRSYVGSLRAVGKTLRLNTLRYVDEVIPVESLGLPVIALSQKEVKVGCDLINQLTEPFELEKFENEHQKKLQELLDRKARGEKVAILRPKRLKPTRPDTLLKTLEASLKRVA